MIALDTVEGNGLEGGKGEIGDQVGTGCRILGRRCCELAWS